MEETTIRECTTIEEFDRCIQLQREAFGFPDLELSPRRHLIVSREAGGWTLGAFVGDRMVGFVHHLAAVRGNEIFGYSHVMAVAKDYQNKGVGARLKWAQRERALGEGREFITWTWHPMQARNAHFNLNRLGVIADTYVDNFYGIEPSGLPGDRLFAMWRLNSARVVALAAGSVASIEAKPVATVAIPSEWISLVKQDPQRARAEQARVREEFTKAFAQGLICAGFERGDEQPRYLLFEPSSLPTADCQLPIS
ncbi:MAG TPA: GNAT family N-acetyltransferase [Pyrinomonadaceae bacterium]